MSLLNELENYLSETMTVRVGGGDKKYDIDIELSDGSMYSKSGTIPLSIKNLDGFKVGKTIKITDEKIQKELTSIAKNATGFKKN